MRLNPSKYPKCDALAVGVWETVPCLALIEFDESGEAEYAGESKVQWDGQTPEFDDEDQVRLECPEGHYWDAEFVDDPVVRVDSQ